MLNGFWRNASKSCSLHCVKNKTLLQPLHLHVIVFITSYKSDIQLIPLWNLTIPRKIKTCHYFFSIILHYKSCLTKFCYDVLNLIFDLFFRTLHIVQVKKRTCCIFAKKNKWMVISGLLTLVNFRTKINNVNLHVNTLSFKEINIKNNSL